MAESSKRTSEVGGVSDAIHSAKTRASHPCDSNACCLVTLEQRAMRMDISASREQRAPERGGSGGGVAVICKVAMGIVGCGGNGGSVRSGHRRLQLGEGHFQASDGLSELVAIAKRHWPSSPHHEPHQLVERRNGTKCHFLCNQWLRFSWREQCNCSTESSVLKQSKKIRTARQTPLYFVLLSRTAMPSISRSAQYQQPPACECSASCS